MDYLEVTFTISATPELLPIARDLAEDSLAAAGFESFIDTDDGMKGYVQEDNYQPDAIGQMLSEAAVDGAEVTYVAHTAPRQDWNEQWEAEGFSPVWVDDRLVVHDGRHLPDRPADLSIEIDARLAFGTGNHVTTRMMLSFILDCDLKGTSVLDCGTGTGVLSIAALKLGAGDALGFDIDEWSVDNAEHNAKLNGVGDRFFPAHGGTDLVPLLPTLYHYIFANINRNVLIAGMEDIMSGLRDNGTLILSGFYTSDIPLVEACAKRYGLELVATKTDGEWAALKFGVKGGINHFAF